MILGAPFLLLSVIALAAVRRPAVSAAVRLDRARAIEGELVEATITLTSDLALRGVGVQLRTPRGLRVESPPVALSVSIPAGGTRDVAVSVRCVRWGGYAVGDVHLAWQDVFGVFRFDHRFDGRAGNPLKVYPSSEHIRLALRPEETQVFAGNQVSRLRGEGIELADIRPFVAGDVVRRVNWRVTARRGELHVNDMHRERNADVIVFLDTFTELREGGVSTLDLAVRGAAALVERHLAQRDRVGLVSFGGTLRWLRPSSGQVQLYRLVDSLIDTEVHLSYAWKGLEVIPRRVLPPKSMVVAFTPLLDERSVGALADLRTRGHDVTIVEMAAETFVPPGPSETDRIAYRLWVMEREALRSRFRQLGVAIAPWPLGGRLQAALEEVRTFRRSARTARA